MNTYDISVIVPVYNAEKFLPRCLDSLMKQRGKNIEVIVINDGSPGPCEAIVTEYMRQSHNIRYIAHTSNKSLFQARISGARAASGKYLLHLDADDWISDDTCEDLFVFAEKHAADVVQYPMYYGPSTEKMQTMWCNRIGESTLAGKEILSAFLDGTLWWTICGKLFLRDTFIKALDFAEAHDGLYINNTEDMALFLSVCCVAEKYANTDSRGKYYYYVNPKSLTKSAAQNDATWDRLCHSLETCYELTLRILQKYGATEAEFDLLRQRHQVTLRWCMEQVKFAQRERWPELLYKLLSAYGTARQPALLDAFFMPLCLAASSIPPKPRAIEHIGIFSSQLRVGGGERVACLLADLFLSLGRRVTFFTDEPEQPEDYGYQHDAVQRIVLQREADKRRRRIQDVCCAEKIDLCIFNDHCQTNSLYDLLAAKLSNCSTVVIEHSFFFYLLHEHKYTLFSMRHEAYHAADALICMSPVNEAWWNAAGYPQAIYIPNPPTFNTERQDRSNGQNNTLLFVGRICEVKGALDLLFVLRDVLRHVPDARLIVCGDFQNESYRFKFTEKMHDLGVEDHIHLAGHVAAVAGYYSQAAVHLMPSVAEGFPMALMEAKAHGLPSVLYSMPYLAAASEDQGCIMVGKEDVHGMSQAILALLRDRAYWRDMSDKAYNSLERYSGRVVREKWQALLTALEGGRVAEYAAVQRGTQPEQPLLPMALREMVCAMRHASMPSAHDGAEMLPSYLFVLHRLVKKILPHNSRRRRWAKQLYTCIRRTARRFT